MSRWKLQLSLGLGLVCIGMWIAWMTGSPETPGDGIAGPRSVSTQVEGAASDASRASNALNASRAALRERLRAEGVRDSYEDAFAAFLPFVAERRVAEGSAAIEREVDKTVVSRAKNWLAIEFLKADIHLLVEVLSYFHGRNERQSVLNGAISHCILNQTKETIGIIENELKGAEKNRGYRDAIEGLLRLTRIDEAVKLHASMPPSSSRDLLIRNIASTFAKKDIVGAVSWARGLGDPQEARRYMIEALHEAKDESALDYLLTSEVHPANRNRIIQSMIVARMLRGNLTGAVQFSETLADSERDIALAQILAMDVERPFPESIRKAHEIKDAGAQSMALQGIIKRQLVVAPDAIVAEVANYEEATPYSLTNALIHQWAPKNREGVSKWIGSLPSGPKRDAAAAGFVRYLKYESKTAARAAAMMIGDAGLRAQVLNELP